MESMASFLQITKDASICSQNPEIFMERIHISFRMCLHLRKKVGRGLSAHGGRDVFCFTCDVLHGHKSEADVGECEYPYNLGARYIDVCYLLYV